VVGKVFEKIIFTQLYSLFRENKLLLPHQGAFWQGKSIEEILLVSVDYTVKSLDSVFGPEEGLWLAGSQERLKELNVTSGAVARRIHYVKKSDQFSDWQPMLGGIT